jgi:hypothetical protein
MMEDTLNYEAYCHYKSFNVYDDESRDCKSIITQFSYPFLCTLSTATDLQSLKISDTAATFSIITIFVKVIQQYSIHCL